MANHRQIGTSARKQIVMSEKSKIFVERYLTPKGKRLILLAVTKEKKNEIWNKYGKNKYRKNPNAVPCRNKIGGVLILYHT